MAQSPNIEPEVALLSAARSRLAVYAEFGVQPPSYLIEQRDTAEAGIKRKMRDELERQLRVAQARFETLKTPDQKRADAKSEIERLTALLAQ